MVNIALLGLESRVVADGVSWHALSRASRRSSRNGRPRWVRAAVIRISSVRRISRVIGIDGIRADDGTGGGSRRSSSDTSRPAVPAAAIIVLADSILAPEAAIINIAREPSIGLPGTARCTLPSAGLPAAIPRCMPSISPAGMKTARLIGMEAACIPGVEASAIADMIAARPLHVEASGTIGMEAAAAMKSFTGEAATPESIRGTWIVNAN